jgi:uncharacterized protein (DUF1330 family)
LTDGIIAARENEAVSAYLICTVRVDDPETYKLYTARTPALIAKHGGRFLVRGGPVETLEGAAFEDRMVVIEFPSMEAARALYTSPEYQAAMIHRRASSQATFLLAEGAPDGDAAPDAKVVTSG